MAREGANLSFIAVNSSERKAAPRLDHPQALHHVGVVLHGGERRDLRHRVHVEGLADAVEQRDAVGIGHRVAHPQPGQARRLGEGAQRGRPSPLLR